MDTIRLILHNLYIRYIILVFKLIYSLFNYLIIYLIMSEQLNKELRDFFIKLGKDIKASFNECCPCDCFGRRRIRIYAKNKTDIEKQVTDDINNAPSDHVIIDIDELKKDKSNSDELMFRNKIIINKILHPTELETKTTDIIGDEENTDLDSDEDFIIIF